MMLEYIYQNLCFTFVRSSFRRGEPGKYGFIGMKNWKETQISWDTSKVMQSHSMTEGAEFKWQTLSHGGVF